MHIDSQDVPEVLDPTVQGQKTSDLTRILMNGGDLLCFAGHLLLEGVQSLHTLFPHFYAFLGRTCFYAHPESSTDRPVVRNLDLMPSVF